MNDKIREAICDKSCSQAMENIFKGNWVGNIAGYVLASENYGMLLQRGFDWSLSPQGYEYWEGIREETF